MYSFSSATVGIIFPFSHRRVAFSVENCNVLGNKSCGRLSLALNSHLKCHTFHGLFGRIFSKKSAQLFLFSYAFEWRSILFYVHKLPCISVALNPLFCLWVIGLRAFFNHSNTTVIAIRCIFSHWVYLFLINE